MPIVLILLSSIGWLVNVVIAFQAVNLGDTASVNGHTSNAILFLWVLAGSLIWQTAKK